MRLLDRLIIKELAGPWLFGVGMFTSLLMAATFLGRLTGWVVDGVPGELIFQMFLLYLPAILVKTFSMAMLLAALLGFGRLSSDSEIVALKAAGANIFRIVLPAGLFAAAITALTFAFNESVVPQTSQHALELTNRIVKSTKVNAARPFATTRIENGKLKFAIIAKNTNVLQSSLEGVTVISYDAAGNESLIMLAKSMRFESLSDLKKWRVEGGATLLTPDFRYRTTLTGDVWPEAMPVPQESFTEMIKERDDDFDAMTMAQLAKVIADHKAKGSRTVAQIANYEYGYWNKFSVPLASIVFGVLGAVLGIRNHRTGTAVGFALAVGIIFAYVTLANFMAVWAQGGVLPAWAASFAPIVIGTVGAGLIMWRRNG